MKQLTIGDVLSAVAEMKDSGMTTKQIESTPVFLGDDDELNGIHGAWFVNIIDADSHDESDVFMLDLISQAALNPNINGTATIAVIS